MNASKPRLWLLGLTLPLLIAAGAQAQSQPYGPSGPPVARYGATGDDGYPPPPPPPRDGYGPQQPDGPAPSLGYGARPPSSADMAQMFRARLSLRPDQDEALNAFLQAVAPPPGMERRMREDEAAARTMTTPQRLDLAISEMDQMRRVMVGRAQATRAFYNQLNPEQQRAFDAMGGQSGPEAMSGPGGFGPRSEPPGGPNSAFGNGSGAPR
jgi:hypothetical protein